jgi:hypothetical protein
METTTTTPSAHRASGAERAMRIGVMENYMTDEFTV